MSISNQFIDLIDPGFITYLRDQGRLDILDNIDKFFRHYMSYYIQFMLGRKMWHMHKEFRCVESYYTQYNSEEAPLLSVLYNQEIDEYLIVSGIVFISRDGEYRPVIIQLTTEQLERVYPEYEEVDKMLRSRGIKLVNIREEDFNLNTEYLSQAILVLLAAQWQDFQNLENTSILGSYLHVMKDVGASISVSDELYMALTRLIFSYNLIYAGVKMIPLTEEYVKTQIDSIRPDYWKELYIGFQINKLFANFICLGFPILVTWILVEDYNYENPMIQEKIRLSGKMESIKDAYQDVATEQNSDVGEYIKSSVKYLNKHLIYSNMSLGLLITGVGHPFGSLPYLKDVNTFEDVSDPDRFRALLFNIVYSLYCMNSKLGIIHNDLHVNNVCVDNTGFGWLFYKIDSIYYAVDPGKLISFVIDFSRAIICPHKQPSKSCKSEILTSYRIFFPDFYKLYGTHIRTVMEQYPVIMYKLYTAIDLFRFTSGLLPILNSMNHPSIDLVSDLNKMCLYSLTEIVSHVGDSIKDANDIEYPNKVILETAFGDLAFSKEEVGPFGKILLFNYDNDLTYSDENPNIFMKPSKKLCKAIKNLDFTPEVTKTICSG